MIQNTVRFALFAAGLLFLNSPLFAADEASSDKPIDVIGTLADHDYFATPFGKIYLPRLFLLHHPDKGYEFKVYASTYSALESEFFEEHDHALHPLGGYEVTIDFSITSHLVWFWLSILVALWLTLRAASYFKRDTSRNYAPKGAFINIFEVIFEFVRDEIAKQNIDERKYKKYVPYLFAIFMSIAFMNLFGLLPWAATATADLTVTGTLAFISFIVIQFSGTKDHWQHIFWFPGVPVAVKLLMMLVETIGQFTKPFALAIRLFANMLSGKIIILTILGLIFIFADLFGAVAGYGVSVFSVLLTSVIYILKAFVALLQAYIFTLLTAVFIGMAAEEHDHSHEHELTTH